MLGIAKSAARLFFIKTKRLAPFYPALERPFVNKRFIASSVRRICDAINRVSTNKYRRT